MANKTARAKSNPSNLTPAQFADESVMRGPGGETHQIAEGLVPVLTTAQGIPIFDDQNSLKIGPCGPVLLEDFALREKIFHFDHERIPERAVHARGFGAHGFFEITDPSLSKLSTADVFQRPGEKTPAFVRFSTVAGNKGSADLARDVRGFAVKMYTQQGNWDLVGNNIPIFFVQDAIKFPDLIHAAKQEPDRGFPQAQTAHDNFWDFISLSPESMHMIMWIMSDRTIPRSFRFMEGFGVHTFRLIDAAGKTTYVKFHWKPKLGLQSVAWNEAVKVNGADPDFHRRDLWDAISLGDFPEWEFGVQTLNEFLVESLHPEWEFGVQTFDEEFIESFDFDVLDATKLIPEELVPVKIVGRLVLNRVVDNFFAETEQVAFNTTNVPPGIGFTNDPLLQGRNFSYLDTQLKRLGSTNFTHLPINAPKCPFATFQQDGHMAMINPKGRANYEPNSWGPDAGGPRESPTAGYKPANEAVSGDKLQAKGELFADHYSQARQFFVSQTPVEQTHIIDALVFELSKVERPDIRARMVSHLLNIDAELADLVADGLGMTEMPEPATPAREVIMDLPPSKALSIIENGPKSFRGRKLGILVTDGVDMDLLSALQDAVAAAGGIFELIAPKIGGVVCSDGMLMPAKQKVNGGPSVLYDAVAVLASAEGAALLAQEATAKDFVNDAFAHAKFIAYAPDALPLFEKANLVDDMDDGCFALKKASDAKAFIKACGELRFWAREEKVHAV